ncbi:hypothetical protein DL238_10405 [Alteriqipengyuania lutimaris]|uniref:Uncharacterized protein n=2 Tax=Alteriqipengyuania lutimaris TaxID=1538146 RepID=A0A395LMU5_9SPHN|nr:hypothetical protein DL238_10405 [Alteriqipengyuania lutimaris]
MAGKLALIAAGLAVTGCANEAPDSEAQQRADAEAVAQVMAQQTPPPIELALQPITYDDIVADERLSGPGCSFYPTDAEDPFAILGSDLAFVKYEGSVQRLAADAGSGEGPFDTREKYDGREYVLKVAYDEAAVEQGDGYWAAPATARVEDGFDRQVAQHDGRLACGG